MAQASYSKPTQREIDRAELIYSSTCQRLPSAVWQR